MRTSRYSEEQIIEILFQVSGLISLFIVNNEARMSGVLALRRGPNGVYCHSWILDKNVWQCILDTPRYFDALKKTVRQLQVGGALICGDCQDRYLFGVCFSRCCAQSVLLCPGSWSAENI